MRRWYSGATLLLLVVTTSLVAADGPIRLPVPSRVEPPAPAPLPPDAAVGLPVGSLYVVNSKVECVVRDHPKGLVKVEAKKGPRDVSATFVDGKGGIEDRTYEGPFLYVITSVPGAKGRVEIDFVPVGLKSAADIVQATIDVNGGKGPQPPPDVEPKDPVTPVITSYRVIFSYDSKETLTPVQKSVIYAKEVSDFLDAHCTKDDMTPGWRRYPRTTDAAGDYDALKAVWGAVKPKITTVPCLVIEVNGHADILPLPATVADAIKTLKQYAGEK